MKVKRLLAFVLTLIMALSVLSGCGQSKEEQDKGAASESSAVSKDSASGNTAGEKKKVETSIALWDLSDLASDDWGKYILDKFNIDIKCVNLSWENFEEQLQTFAASGDLPDFSSKYGLTFEWQEQGLLRDIPEDMINKYPNIKTLFENSEYAQAVKGLTGKYYFLPRPESLTGINKASPLGTFYRKDWMQNVGITKEPETLDELYQMLKAFKEKDPDKNGKNDTYGLTQPGNAGFHYLAPYGVNPNVWVKEDGKWIPGYMSQKCIEGLKFYQKLFNEGIMDPEYQKSSYNEVIGKFAQGKTGAFFRNNDTYWYYTQLKAIEDANKDKGDPLSYVGHIGVLKADANSEPHSFGGVPNCGTMVSSKVSDEVLDRVLEMLDWMMSPEGKDYRRWGLEGKDFKKEGDKYVSLLKKIEGVADSDLLFKTYPSAYFSYFADWDFDYAIEIPGNPNIPDEYKKINMELRNKMNSAILPENTTINIMPTPAKNKLAIDWGTAFAKIVMSKGDVNAAFEKFLAECKSKGVDKAIEEVNKAAAEKGIN